MEYRTRKTERKLDFRPRRKIEEELHRKAVSKRFLELRDKAVEGTSDWRIMMVMAEEMGCTTNNVRHLLLKSGTICLKRKVRRR